MADQPASLELLTMRDEKRTVARNSFFAAIVITAMKAVVGITTGSLGILSEAAHSALDMVAAFITLVSVRVSDKPADADHLYGHGKVENFSAFIETGLLLLTCVWIIWEASRRLFFHPVDIQPTPAAFIVMAISMVIDAAPPGVRAQIVEAVSRLNGVLELDRVRIRRAGNRYFADLNVGLARNVTFQRAEQLAEEVTNTIRRVLPNVDVVVHSVPRAAGGENIFDRIRAVATRNNLNVHDVSVQDLAGRLHVEQHLELDESLNLKQGHDVVTAVEAEMRREVPEISSILTHIESEPSTIETGDEIQRDADIERRLSRIVAEFPEVLDMHDVAVKRVRDRIYVSCHCTMPDDLPLSRVHDISTALEIRFKQDAPEIFKVLIHPEPRTDNRR